MKDNIFYSICAFLFLGVVAFAFVPHILKHSHPTQTEEAQVPIDKKFVVLCPKPKNSVTVSITSKGFVPQITKAHTCDTLVFINSEKLSVFQIGFGEHPNHLAYPGYKEKIIGPGEKLSILLTAFGTYQIHDHLKDEIEGKIVIVNP